MWAVCRLWDDRTRTPYWTTIIQTDIGKEKFMAFDPARVRSVERCAARLRETIESPESMYYDVPRTWANEVSAPLIPLRWECELDVFFKTSGDALVMESVVSEALGPGGLRVQEAMWTGARALVLRVQYTTVDDALTPDKVSDFIQKNEPLIDTCRVLSRKIL